MSDYYRDEPAGPLFAPHVATSATSRAAAASLEPSAMSDAHRLILDLLRNRPAGLTDEEMQRTLAMNPSTQRPRRVELVRRGLVVEDGTRPTASGRKASVWKVKPSA